MYADRVVHSVVPVPGAPEVDGFGTDVAPLLEALSPEERLDMVSRKDSPLNTGELNGCDAPAARRLRPAAVARRG